MIPLQLGSSTPHSFLFLSHLCFRHCPIVLSPSADLLCLLMRPDALRVERIHCAHSHLNFLFPLIDSVFQSQFAHQSKDAYPSGVHFCLICFVQHRVKSHGSINPLKIYFAFGYDSASASQLLFGGQDLRLPSFLSNKGKVKKASSQDMDFGSQKWGRHRCPLRKAKCI